MSKLGRRLIHLWWFNIFNRHWNDWRAGGSIKSGPIRWHEIKKYRNSEILLTESDETNGQDV
jgi:hypothetical protein